jgi:hypothetical protein
MLWDAFLFLGLRYVGFPPRSFSLVALTAFPCENNLLSGTTKQKGVRKKKPHMLKREEHEGMPQHKHCPHAKRREDKNLKVP